MEHFITAAVFNYPHEITILRHLLEDEGLQYYFENETMADLLPMYSYAMGGIRLKVHPNDLATVQEILDTLNTTTHLKIV
ncbi:DUF2007 domain-containing protein [Flavobacterium sp. DG1-102-2]|uniref:DUF2007 domain-containing protein n=1 Tax=Flavobacterium sp. DG1-102-2 TaxID=3081663 RepID=UPI00294937B0|nr:DUF2007 domain-containing protein [Flavobacterium sp. DG1-102-2]MDV6167744.1 DUF2007 domain-containing protein [Flavobacterium sp. DG1-102-2]